MKFCNSKYCVSMALYANWDRVSIFFFLLLFLFLICFTICVFSAKKLLKRVPSPPSRRAPEACGAGAERGGRMALPSPIPKAVPSPVEDASTLARLGPPLFFSERHFFYHL